MPDPSTRRMTIARSAKWFQIAVAAVCAAGLPPVGFWMYRQSLVDTPPQAVSSSPHVSDAPRSVLALQSDSLTSTNDPDLIALTSAQLAVAPSDPTGPDFQGMEILSGAELRSRQLAASWSDRQRPVVTTGQRERESTTRSSVALSVAEAETNEDRHGQFRNPFLPVLQREPQAAEEPFSATDIPPDTVPTDFEHPVAETYLPRVQAGVPAQTRQVSPGPQVQFNPHWHNEPNTEAVLPDNAIEPKTEDARSESSSEGPSTKRSLSTSDLIPGETSIQSPFPGMTPEPLPDPLDNPTPVPSNTSVSHPNPTVQISSPEYTVQWSQENEELTDWWNFRMADPSRPAAPRQVISLSSLIDLALQNSPRIRSLQRLPQMTATQIDRAESVFDPTIEWNSKYNDTVDPVGNALTTGGAPFLEENTWDSIGRVSRRLNRGSEVSFYQKLGFQNSNSNFFTPQDQGTSTLGIDLTVPLANGSGYEFNQAPIVIAQLDTEVAWSDYLVELQQEIEDLGTLYWNLQNARAVYLQQQRSVQRAEGILRKLEARATYDASFSQIAQAKAELSLRINELQASRLAIRELEISIRERIGDPTLQSTYDLELIPSQFPSEVFDSIPPGINQLIAQALENRGELQREQAKTSAADQQVFVTRSRLAPRLDMVFNVYSSGLRGDTGIGRAFEDQFGNTPGFSGGLEYEIPYGRRHAKANVRKAELQRLQASELWQAQRNQVIAQVQTAYTRWEVALDSYETARQAVQDMRRSVEQLQLRWEEYAFVEGSVSQGATPSLALDQLLAGQRRLSESETRLANAELNLALSRQGILTATGTLLNSQPAAPTSRFPRYPADERQVQ